ncbi:DUF6479 family protein [Actinacidiphila sp. DG2A-62]|uniref:DUF6479 family protein n=1 Tax=Actinacidiphila sp. DG2A-62 TaxID=3108821 RepID=UPI002DBD98AF|nr:DUF6479 family protein [Actinacidiphila sp. DG2A-62]MEC3997878.1 DUF6479 family protein [Actinacidiphila sp. DG2A-62]
MSLYEARAADVAVGGAGSIGPLVLGIVVVIVLIAAVWVGMRRVGKEPPIPQGRRPRAGAWSTRREHDVGAPDDHGPGHQDEGPRTHESREPQPDEMPRDGRRRMPYEVRDAGVRGGKERTRPRRHSGPNVD